MRGYMCQSCLHTAKCQREGQGAKAPHHLLQYIYNCLDVFQKNLAFSVRTHWFKYRQTEWWKWDVAFIGLTGCFDIETYWSLRGVVSPGQNPTGGWGTKENKSFSRKMSPWVRRPTLDADWSACSSIDFRLGWAAVQTKPLVLSCLASDRLINVKSSLVLHTQTHTKCVCVSFIAV